MKYILITNNAQVYKGYTQKYKDKNLYRLDYHPENTFIEILKRTRDFIHKGHVLLTHPLAGSVKPYETPFKSIAVAAIPRELDSQSLEIIEDAISMTESFLKNYQKRDFSERVYDDFRLIDFSLIQSGLESLSGF